MTDQPGRIDSNCSIDLDRLDVALESPAIARLVEEVRGSDFEVTRAYNRTYNRHNR